MLCTRFVIGEETLSSVVPEGPGPYYERNLAQAAAGVKLVGAQATEVGRQYSGAVKPDVERGPKFRASYSGYSLRSNPG